MWVSDTEHHVALPIYVLVRHNYFLKDPSNIELWTNLWSLRFFFFFFFLVYLKPFLSKFYYKAKTVTLSPMSRIIGGLQAKSWHEIDYSGWFCRRKATKKAKMCWTDEYVVLTLSWVGKVSVGGVEHRWLDGENCQMGIESKYEDLTWRSLCRISSSRLWHGVRFVWEFFLLPITAIHESDHFM